MEENEKVKGIALCDNWILGSDSMNVVLYEFGDKFNSKTKEESFGLKKTTYHGNVEQALNHLINKEICNCDFEKLQDIADKIEQVRGGLTKFKTTTKIIGDDTIDKLR